MLIEKMEEKHLESVLEVETLSLKSPWSMNMFAEEIKSKTAMYCVAVDDEKVVAYMGMHCVCGEGHITNVAVHPDYRRKGVASSLINHFILYAKQNNFEFLTLEVRESNEKAIACYTKFGFKEVGKRKKYYEHKEDAILMTLFLG